MRRYETKVVMLAELRVRAEALDDFLDYTTANLPVSRSAAGNLAFDMLLGDADPLLVRFYEEWESAEAQRSYIAGRLAAGDLATLLSFLSAEPRFVALRSVAA